MLVVIWSRHIKIITLRKKDKNKQTTERMVDERMRQVAELPSQEEIQNTVASIDFESMEITDLFHKLEVDVTGYEDYENCTEPHY